MNMKKLSHIYNDFLKSPGKVKLFFVATFIIFAIIITIISFFIGYNYEEKYIKDEIRSKANSFIDEKSKDLKLIVEKQKQTLSSIYTNKIFQEYLQDKKTDQV